MVFEVFLVSKTLTIASPHLYFTISVSVVFLVSSANHSSLLGASEERAMFDCCTQVHTHVPGTSLTVVLQSSHMVSWSDRPSCLAQDTRLQDYKNSCDQLVSMSGSGVLISIPFIMFLSKKKGLFLQPEHHNSVLASVMTGTSLISISFTLNQG